MENIYKNPILFWNKKVPDTELEKFQKIIEEKYNLKFSSYWELHKWTVLNYTNFLEELWHFFRVVASVSYNKVLVKTGTGFLHNEWFSGARLNYAENILRIRDNRTALICLDELGNEETVTYAELYDNVKLYAAAFRRNGLSTGDIVSSFISNRKEAIIAFLATASIGGIWGSTIPFTGTQAATRNLQNMNPKFLFTIDAHQNNGILYKVLDSLPYIVNNTPSLEKVILVATQSDTRKKDLSNIPNCVFLEEFLEDGITCDGKVPEIIFEQLPFDHPICLLNTSGTAGFPKALVHSARTFLSLLGDFALAYNCKSGDVLCLNSIVGWGVWNSFIPSLSLGVTLLLYCGSVCQTIKGKNFWDLLSKFKVNMVILVTAAVDRMEKMSTSPSPNTDMSCLKRVFVVGSPVKKENFMYLRTVNKDLFVGIRYGASEVVGTFSGCDFNMPVYAAEVQVPSLGLDVQCFDAEGNSVIGQRGNLVVAAPAINFPIGIWNDVNEERVRESYLEKFPGVWSQSDECWINPKTKGTVIIGRSDRALKQNSGLCSPCDIYSAIHSMEELEDYLCVSQKNKNGECRIVLFVKLRDSLSLSSELRLKIEKKVEEELDADFVPRLILEVPDIPYNENNKKLETLVSKIIETNSIPDSTNARNPQSLESFVNIPEILKYNV